MAGFEHVLMPTLRTIAQRAVPGAEVEATAASMLKAGLGKDVRAGITKLAEDDIRLKPHVGELSVVFGDDFLQDGLPYTKRTNMPFMDFEQGAPEKPITPAGMKAEDLFPGVFTAIENSGADQARQEIMKRSAREFLGYENAMSPLEAQIANLSNKVLLPFETVTKLGLSSVSQASQILTGVVRTQYKDAFKNTIAAFRDPDAQMFALESGAILSNVVRDAATTLFGSSQVSQKFLNMVGFTKMDIGSRVFGALQGAAFAEHQADNLYKLFRAAQRNGTVHPNVAKIEQRMLKLGIDPRDVIAQGGRLTTDQKLLAANTVAFDVNFWGDSLSLPTFWKSPWGKVVTQFKSFAYQQSKFVKEHVVKPWVQYGDAGPALRFALLIPLGGEAIADVKAILRNKQRTDDDAKRLVENLAQAGGFGIVADAYLQASRGMSGLSSFVLGPAPTDALSAVNAAAEVMEGNPKKAGELALRLAPGALAMAAPQLAAPIAVAGASAPAAAETLFPGTDKETTRSRETRERREGR